MAIFGKKPVYVNDCSLTHAEIYNKFIINLFFEAHFAFSRLVLQKPHITHLVIYKTDKFTRVLIGKNTEFFCEKSIFNFPKYKIFISSLK